MLTLPLGVFQASAAVGRLTQVTWFGVWQRVFSRGQGKLVPETEVRGNPKTSESGKIWVKWFGDHTFAQTELNQLKMLSEGLETHHNALKEHRKGRRMNARLEAAIQEAMVELDRQMVEQSALNSCPALDKAAPAPAPLGIKRNKEMTSPKRKFSISHKMMRLRSRTPVRTGWMLLLLHCIAIAAQSCICAFIPTDDLYAQCSLTLHIAHLHIH